MASIEIERDDITLSDRTKGISADEFAGGSYFYADGIDSGYDTKGFKLGPRISKSILNYRSNGYATNIMPASLDYGDCLAVTYDGRVETDDRCNGYTGGDGDSDLGGALFAAYQGGTISKSYINCVGWGGWLFGLKETRVDILKYDSIYNPDEELLSNPRFSNEGSDWTIGDGWTITSDGAEHTAGNTGTLSATITTESSITTSDYFRIAIKVTNCTKGNISFSFCNGEEDLESGINGWQVYTIRGATDDTGEITITPSSTFDGTIEAVNIHLYNTEVDEDNVANVMINKVSLSTNNDSPYRPAIVRGGDLYVGAGSYVNIISLADGSYGKTALRIVDRYQTIVDITQQAGNLILWTTDGYSSKQYYWNGVDAVATECIEWEGLSIKAVAGTETLSYVLAVSGEQLSVGSEGYEYRLYAVSGYQRSLIASKQYSWSQRGFISSDTYSPLKKFEFNDIENSKSMSIFLDNLFIPGCDGLYKYGSDVPGLDSVMTRPVLYEEGSTRVILGQRGNALLIGYRVNNTNYIGKPIRGQYNTTGYLVTEGIYRDKIATKKALQNIKIGYRNVDKDTGNIKVYIIADDNYFWRFRPTTTPTTRPSVGSIYQVAPNTKAEVIKVDTTEGVITLVTTEDKGSRQYQANQTITKISGEGDNSISVGYDYDNMCLIKTIESDNQGYGSDLIFGEDFVNSYMPMRHKIQFVIELNSNDRYRTPEVYEISFVSDITDITL